MALTVYFARFFGIYIALMGIVMMVRRSLFRGRADRA